MTNNHDDVSIDAVKTQLFKILESSAGAASYGAYTHGVDAARLLLEQLNREAEKGEKGTFEYSGS